MKKSLLSTFALVAISAGSALAADLPIRKAPAMAPAVVTTNWTGCYLGGGGGYGMYNVDSQFGTFPGGVPTATAVTHGGRGWFGTVQIGCDYQFAGRWVIGAFGDYDFSDISGDYRPFIAGGELRLDSSWAAGGRVGYLVNPQLLTFVSGGYTEARFDGVDLSFLGASSPSFTVASRTHSGWFIGGGVEYGLGWLPGLYWKTEYRVAEYERLNVPTFFAVSGVPTDNGVSDRPFVQTVRSELVWRWHWGR